MSVENPEGPPTRRFLSANSPPAPATLVAITGVAAMSMNIFLPSLPHMAEEFGTSYNVMQLSVALYLALTAVTQIILGPLADRYGRRPILLASYAVFAIASLGCILSENVVTFLGFRMLQAAVYSGVVLARTMVRDTMPEDEAASTIGYLTMGMAMVPMVSPTLGGFLDATFGWRASFWLMFGLGSAAIWLIWRDVGETRVRGYSSFAEQFRDYPQLLKSKTFWSYSLAMAFSAGTYFAYLGGAPFVGVQVFRLDSVTLGVLFGASSLGYATGSFLSGRLSRRIGVRRMVFAGCLVTTCAITLSLALFIINLGNQWTFFGFMVLVGVGYGMTLPNAMSGMLSGSAHLAGTASGLGGAIMIGGGAALSALTGAVMVPGAGAERMLIIQLFCACASVVAALFVLRSAKVTPPQTSD